MKKYYNGKIIEMSEEEIAELKKLSTETVNIPPTETERLEAVELAILELAEALANG